MSYIEGTTLTQHRIDQQPLFGASTWAVLTPTAEINIEPKVMLDFSNTSTQSAVVFPAGIKIFFAESLLSLIFSTAFFVMALLNVVLINPLAAFGGILASSGLCFLALLKAYEWKKLNVR